MGIRISKSIGYLVSTENCKRIFTPDFKLKLESLDYEDEVIAKFWEDFSIEMKKHCRIDFISQLYLESKKQPYNFFSEFIFKDKFNGMFFCTLDHHNAKRYDNPIDYYENSKEPKSSIKYLNCCIAPISKYKFSSRIKINGFDTTKFDNAFKLVSTYNAIFSTNLTLEQLVKNGSIIPELEPEIYCFAKAANILNPDVSKEEFDQICKAAIITDWH